MPSKAGGRKLLNAISSLLADDDTFRDVATHKVCSISFALSSYLCLSVSGTSSARMIGRLGISGLPCIPKYPCLLGIFLTYRFFGAPFSATVGGQRD